MWHGHLARVSWAGRPCHKVFLGWQGWPQVAGRGSTSLIATTQWLAMMRVKALPGFCFGVRVTRAALCAGRGTAFRPVHAKAASRGIPLAAALQIICQTCEAPGGSSVCLTGRAARGERSTGFPTRATDRNVRAPVLWVRCRAHGIKAPKGRLHLSPGQAQRRPRSRKPKFCGLKGHFKETRQVRIWYILVKSAFGVVRCPVIW